MSTGSAGLTTAQVQQIWKQACAELQLQLSPAVYNTWIVSNPLTHMTFLSDSEALATITSPTAFHSTNLKKNLHLQIKHALDKHTSRNCNIEYKIGDPSLALESPNGQANGATNNNPRNSAKNSAQNNSQQQNSQGFESIQTTISPTVSTTSQNTNQFSEGQTSNTPPTAYINNDILSQTSQQVSIAFA